MAATPSPNLSDQQFLAADPTFRLRVLESVIRVCFNVGSEATTVAYHYKRLAFASQTLANILANPSQYAVFFAQCVATDTTVLNDATVSGATPLTGANVAAQAALVADGDISNALSAQYNTFFLPF